MDSGDLNAAKPINAAVCIAGAHRSGTSMLTRLLHKCGLELGPESELMPPQADNPDGFWENLRFVALNDEILNELGGAWDLPPDPSEDFQNVRLDPLRKKARSLIDDFAFAKLWGWKDPRNSLTLPFWQALLPALKVLIVVRNPLEVAYSMRSRNGTSYSFGLRLWEIYNRRLIAAARGKESLVTDYDSFFEGPETTLKRIADFIGLPSSGINNATAIVTPKRRHTKFTTEQLTEAHVSQEIVSFYRELTAKAKSPVDGVHISIESGPVTSGSAKNVMLPETPSRLNMSIPDSETRRRTAVREFNKLLARFVQTNRLLHERSIELAKSESHALELNATLRRQLQSVKRLSRFLDDVDDAALRLRDSRRWKLANPIAALKAKLGGRSLAGYGHLEKIVSAYSKWRSAHPDIAEIDDAIQRSASPAAILAKTRKFGNRSESAPIKPIEFRVHEEVEVSIIIPVFNQFSFTQACLASIQEHQGDERFEVIVIDDGSTDATVNITANLPGIVYLRNETNQGFIVSCNRGAEKARGKFLVFLNNDTEATAGWLTALRETFEFEKETGLVGSKLLFPDGRLQEAGGIIWRDATGWNRGKFDDPDKPEYNFLREVDYCSAACLMIPRSTFKSVGGFDLKYAPAYYEDTDLAFKVRERGLKVLYQPLSEVIHYEGATAGTDISMGAKKYQEINRATFAKDWTEALLEKPISGDIAALERLKPGQRRILVIDHHLPTPDRDSGSLRMFQILKILHGLGHRVTFIPDNVADIPPYADALRKRGIEVICYPYFKSVREYLETHGRAFDIVILSRCDFARKHLANVRLHSPQSRVIFDTVDLHFLRHLREAELTGNREMMQKALQKKEEEYEVIDHADETWVVSTFEQELLLRGRPNKPIEVVSNIVDAPGSSTPFFLRHDFLFIGSFEHTPNVDAILFFTKQIYPLVRERLKDVTFYVIGDKAPPEVIALASEDVVITGLQPDVRPYFDSVKLSIAPLRFGAGMKGKVNQSMGLGVPVVATSIAVEGMALTSRQDILIADTPEDFANALVDLYESEELWNRISRNGLEKTRAAYSGEVALKQLARLFNDNHLDPSVVIREKRIDVHSSERKSSVVPNGAIT